VIAVPVWLLIASHAFVAVITWVVHYRLSVWAFGDEHKKHHPEPDE